MIKQPDAHREPAGDAWRKEPVQPKQKAVLEFLKMPVPPTRGGASNMIKAVFEGPSGYSHLNAWEIAKHTLHPSLFPAEPEKKSSAPAPSSGSLLGLLFKMALLSAVLFYGWRWYQEKHGVDDSDTPSAFTMPAPAPAPTVPAKSPAPTVRKAGDGMLTLDSTDGRSIQAQVLALTKETVLVRRADGQTFDIPITRLTPASKQRIDDYRAAKRTGQVK